jgi:ABC-type lipoprotein release transport system permease subunit
MPWKCPGVGIQSREQRNAVNVVLGVAMASSAGLAAGSKALLMTIGIV